MEKPDIEHRDVVKWGYYSTMQQVQELLAALNPHGIRENALREAIEVCRKVPHTHTHTWPRARLVYRHETQTKVH